MDVPREVAAVEGIGTMIEHHFPHHLANYDKVRNCEYGTAYQQFVMYREIRAVCQGVGIRFRDNRSPLDGVVHSQVVTVHDVLAVFRLPFNTFKNIKTRLKWAEIAYHELIGEDSRRPLNEGERKALNVLKIMYSDSNSVIDISSALPIGDPRREVVSMSMPTLERILLASGVSKPRSRGGVGLS